MSMVAAARKLLGTPFRARARLPGVGIDCVGVVIVCLRAVGACPPAWDFDGYSMTTADGGLERELLRFTDEVSLDEALPGDVLTFVCRRRSRAQASHCAVLTSPGRVVHAPIGAWVVEVDIPVEWGAARAFRPRMGA